MFLVYYNGLLCPDYYYYHYLVLYLFSPIVRLRSSVKSRSQPELIYPSTLRMICAVLISVIFCSSMADGLLLLLLLLLFLMLLLLLLL